MCHMNCEIYFTGFKFSYWYFTENDMFLFLKFIYFVTFFSLIYCLVIIFSWLLVNVLLFVCNILFSFVTNIYVLVLVYMLCY